MHSNTAAQNWSKRQPAQPVARKKPTKSRKFSHLKKRQPSRTRKGRLDFVTHKGDKCFNKGKVNDLMVPNPVNPIKRQKRRKEIKKVKQKQKQNKNKLDSKTQIIY